MSPNQWRKNEGAEVMNRKKLAGTLGMCCFVAHGVILKGLPWPQIVLALVVISVGNGLYWYSMSGDDA